MFCIYLRKTATCATYSINWLVFITELKSVYWLVQTGSLNKVQCCSPQIRSNLMVNKWCCFYSVTSVHALWHSLSQWLLLVLSTTLTVKCYRRCLVIHIGAVLLLCYCKWYFMALLIRILPNILICHGSLVILMFTYLCIFFHHILDMQMLPSLLQMLGNWFSLVTQLNWQYIQMHS